MSRIRPTEMRSRLFGKLQFVIALPAGRVFGAPDATPGDSKGD